MSIPTHARTGSSATDRSHRNGHAQPRYTAAHWNQSLQQSPQLRAELASAGVNVQALSNFAAAARSKNVPLNQLAQFVDPRPRGSPTLMPFGGENEYQQQHQSTANSPARQHQQIQSDWNLSRNVDWKLLNGSRELSLLCTETALAHPDTQAGRIALERLQDIGQVDPYRKTDVRTGHRLDAVVPTKERFVQDAYYARIIDLRKSQEGKAPEKRLPAPVLYNGMCLEGQPKDEKQAEVLAKHSTNLRERYNYLDRRTKHHFGIAPDPSIPNPAEYTTHQSKKPSIHHAPAAAENTYNRLFHLDLPKPQPGHALADRSPAGLAREQWIRDRSTHGRAYEPLGNTLIQVIPVSEAAQQAYALSGPNAIGRARQDQRNAQLQQPQTQAV